MNRYLGFDLELAEEFDTESASRKYGISCLEVIASDTQESTVWAGSNRQPMTKEQCIEAVTYMEHMVSVGYKIVTWSGLSFDFPVLGEASNLQERCAKLAIGHLDMMFQFFCRAGYPLGINAVAAGAGIEGKHDGMSGKDAPQMWKDGNAAEVLSYLHRDVQMTNEVAEMIEKKQRVNWTSRSGRRRSQFMGSLWTVKECLSLPEPDNSWMSNPMHREDFLAWAVANGGLNK